MRSIPAGFHVLITSLIPCAHYQPDSMRSIPAGFHVLITSLIPCAHYQPDSMCSLPAGFHVLITSLIPCAHYQPDSMCSLPAGFHALNTSLIPCAQYQPDPHVLNTIASSYTIRTIVSFPSHFQELTGSSSLVPRCSTLRVSKPILRRASFQDEHHVHSQIHT